MKRPNLLLFMPDQLRADCVGAFDNPGGRTPNIDEFAASAVRFENAALPDPDDRAYLDRMPGSTIPVIRQPFEPGDMLPFWAAGETTADRHYLFDLDVDPNEAENRAGEARESELIELLRTALSEVSAPAEQFERLGIA